MNAAPRSSGAVTACDLPRRASVHRSLRPTNFYLALSRRSALRLLALTHVIIFLRGGVPSPGLASTPSAWFTGLDAPAFSGAIVLGGYCTIYL